MTKKKKKVWVGWISPLLLYHVRTIFQEMDIKQKFPHTDYKKIRITVEEL